MNTPVKDILHLNRLNRVQNNSLQQCLFTVYTVVLHKKMTLEK